MFINVLGRHFEHTAIKKIVTGQKVLTNSFCKILNCLFFNFLFTSCAHKQSVTKVIRATTKCRIPNPISLSSYFKNYAYFEIFSLKKKCVKTDFLLVCEVCTNNLRTPCIYAYIYIYSLAYTYVYVHYTYNPQSGQIFYKLHTILTPN